MIPALRQSFNRNFTPEKYQALLRLLADRAGVPIRFRVSETPCFFPKSFLDQMSRCGAELLRQVEQDEYRKVSDAAIPPQFNAPHEAPHPLFAQVDFGLVRNPSGELQPKLVELQGFPSLYAYQPLLSEAYLEIFGLDGRLQYFLGGLDRSGYRKLLDRAIVGGEDPGQVILMEIDPLDQKTLADFLATEKLLGISTVSITDIRKDGRQLSYESQGRRIPIRRIYNRAIVDELQRKDLQVAFRFTDDLDVTWAGHPNWFFRLSKFSLPYLHHPCVPKTWFVDQLDRIPDDLSAYVLKPLFSFAGLGVVIQPRKEDVAAIPRDQRSQYILQERMDFEPLIETPFGKTKAEVRIMYIWLEEPRAAMTVIRMGRGLMMGVDHNRDMEWVGSSAALYLED
jgi:hypothetical protein